NGLVRLRAEKLHKEDKQKCDVPQNKEVRRLYSLTNGAKKGYARFVYRSTKLMAPSH
ncbi:hypothetical protein J6590_001001, partial [Homalodisca vitripennis]